MANDRSTTNVGGEVSETRKLGASRRDASAKARVLRLQLEVPHPAGTMIRPVVGKIKRDRPGRKE